MPVFGAAYGGPERRRPAPLPAAPLAPGVITLAPPDLLAQEGEFALLASPPPAGRRLLPLPLEAAGRPAAALQLDIALRIFGCAGACVALDAAAQRLGLDAALRALLGLAAECRRLRCLLVAATAAPESTQEALARMAAGTRRGLAARRRLSPSAGRFPPPAP